MDILSLKGCLRQRNLSISHHIIKKYKLWSLPKKTGQPDKPGGKNEDDMMICKKELHTEKTDKLSSSSDFKSQVIP